MPDVSLRATGCVILLPDAYICRLILTITITMRMMMMKTILYFRVPILSMVEMVLLAAETQRIRIRVVTKWRYLIE